MPQVRSNGISLEYERSGAAGGEPILLIHGVGAQLIRWPQRLCDGLGAAGFDVIRFDNRDVGLSTHMDGAPVPALAAITRLKQQGGMPVLPYTLSDMAADAAGLLDGLGIASAHVLGVSLGGMIAQVLAIEHRHRLRTMTIMMSQSGNNGMQGANPEALGKLSAPAPDPAVDEEAFLRHSVALNRALGSPAYPADETVLRALGRLAASRAYDPAGAARQLAAARGAPDRRQALSRLDLPALVIHGVNDPLVPLAAGREIAEHIPKAWFLQVDGMGHDLPDALTDLFVSTVCANARRGTNPAAVYSAASRAVE